MDMDALQYPIIDDVGTTQAWDLPLDYGRLQFTGVLLGMATTYQDAHTHPGQYAPKGRKCQGCRWSELHVFQETSGDKRFIIFTVGASDVPGEVDRCRVRYGKDPWEVVYNLSSQHPENTERRLISFVARRAIEAAGLREPNFILALDDWDKRTGTPR